METPVETPVESVSDESNDAPVELSTEFPAEPPGELVSEPATPKPRSSRFVIWAAIIVVVLAVAGTGGFFGYQAFVQGNEDRLVQRASEALVSGDFVSAEQAASQALGLKPPAFLQQTGRAAVILADALVSQRKYASALPVLDSAIAADPQNASLLGLRGRAYQGNGQPDLALADFKSSLALDPEQPSLLDAQARLALQTGDLETARAAASAAGKLDATLSLPYAFQAEVLYAGFDYGETIKAATQSIQRKDPPALAYRLRGGAYYWLYDFTNAKTDLEKALDLDPEDAEAALLLALMASEKGDLDGLKAASDQAAAIDPASVPALAAQAALADFNYDHIHARNLIDQAITLASGRPELYILRTTIYTSTIDEAAWQADVEKVIELSPSHRLARTAQANWNLHMEDLDSAESIGLQLVEEFPTGEDGYLILNDVYDERYELEKALEIIDKGLAAAGESYGFYSSRGYTYYLMGKYDEARKDYEKSLSLVPDRATTIASLGYIAYLNGDTTVALERYQQALDLDPSLSGVYLSRAGIYDEQDQSIKAQADRKKAAAIDEQSRSVILEEAQKLYSEKKYIAALDKVDALLTRYPRLDSALVLRGWIYLAQGKPSLARREIEDLLEVIPNHPDAHQLLGVIELAEGKYDIAMDEVGQVLEIQPRNAYAYALQGDIYISQGEMDKAEASYLKSLDLDPKIYNSYISLAMIRIYQDKNDQAAKDLKNGLKGGPNPTAEVLLNSLENLPEGFKLYFHTNWKYAIAVPKNAQANPVQQENNAAVVYFSVEDADTFYNIWVYWYESDSGQVDDPAFFSGGLDEAIKRAVPSYTEGELSEFKALNTSGIKHPYRMVNQYEGQSYNVVGNMYFFSAQGRNMLVECTTLEGMEGDLDKVFDQIVATFAFLP